MWIVEPDRGGFASRARRCTPCVCLERGRSAAESTVPMAVWIGRGGRGAAPMRIYLYECLMGWFWSSAALLGVQFVVWCLFSVPRPGLRELKRSSRPGSTRTPFFIVSLEHGSAVLEASGWGRFCTTSQARRCKPNTNMRTGRAHGPVLQTRKGGLFSPGFGRPQAGRQAGLATCR
jgi:hypothetical protein